MNLALLDPFRRQVPDRIDSTLALPRTFHPPRPSSSSTLLATTSTATALASPSTPSSSAADITSPTPRKRRAAAVASRSTSSLIAASQQYSKTKRRGKARASSSANANDDGTNADNNGLGEGETNEWHSCFAVSFNPRGNYIGAGHGSGIVPIHDFASRTLSSIFAPPHSTLKKHLDDVYKKKKKKQSKKSKKKRKRSMGGDSDGGGGNDEKDQDGDGKVNDDEYGESGDENEKKNCFHIAESSLTAGSDQKTRKRKQQVLQKLEQDKKRQERLLQNGITSISWSRDSRTMLVASYKDSHVCLVNHDHPYGPEDAYFGLTTGARVGGNDSSTSRDTGMGANGSRSSTPIPGNNNANDKESRGEETGSATGVDEDDVEEGESQEKEASDEDDSDAVGEQNQVASYNIMIKNMDNMKRFVYKDALYVSNVNLLEPEQGIRTDANNDTNDQTSSKQTNKVELTSEELSILMKPPPYTNEEDFILQRLSMRLECKDYTIEQAYQATQKKIAQTTKYQTLIMGLPHALGLCAQIHPIGNGGLACLEDGSLVLFRMPYGGFEDHLYANQGLTEDMKSRKMRVGGDYVYLSRPRSQGENESGESKSDHMSYHDDDTSTCMPYHIICATFDARGNRVYAATKCGKIILYQLDPQFEGALFPRYSSSPSTDPDDEDPSQFFVKKFSHVAVIKILPSGGSSAAPIQIVLSRNGQMLLLNGKDGVLRLYDTSVLWRESRNNNENTKDGLIHVKPRHSFQDLVSNSKWASCDFSGDGEYVVGGCNNDESGDKYELYFWNTVNGTLIDQLMGPQIQLYSLSWHPTRSFIAVGTSDGMVDIWGPRLDWTNFAPDFQSLQKNVEYVEKEDEFDVVLDVDHDDEAAKRNKIEEEAIVNVIAVDDESGDEDGLFYFDAKMRNDKARV